MVIELIMDFWNRLLEKIKITYQFFFQSAIWDRIKSEIKEKKKKIALFAAVFMSALILSIALNQNKNAKNKSKEEAKELKNNLDIEQLKSYYLYPEKELAIEGLEEYIIFPEKVTLEESQPDLKKDIISNRIFNREEDLIQEQLNKLNF